MLYQVMATIVYSKNRRTTTKQIPTFYLNGDVQGVVDKKHAASIAMSIVDISDDPNVEVSVSVKEIKELKWN
jgi:hypothetical protein